MDRAQKPNGESEMTERKTGETFGVRIPYDLLEELDAMKPLLLKLPEYQATSLSRSALIRIAVAHGTRRMRELLQERIPDAEQVDLLEGQKKGKKK